MILTGMEKSIWVRTKQLVPDDVKKGLKRYLRRRYPRYCPICNTRHMEFLPFGRLLRPGALCPECKGLERHRLLWLFLQRHTDLWQRRPLWLLHFAPEKDFGQRIAAIAGISYVSTDLAPSRTPDILTDITALGFRDGAFDAMICSHVLEHVPDDRAAMRECWRTLRPGGWLAVQTPMQAGPTDEDTSVLDPAERERRFGQDDHVRMYGPDLVDRLREAGFAVTVYPRERVLVASDGDVGVPPTEPPIIFCRRPTLAERRGSDHPKL